MAKRQLYLHYDSDIDLLEMYWDEGNGVMEPTPDDRVLMEEDNEGRVVGLMVWGIRDASGKNAIRTPLERSKDPIVVPVRIAAERLGVSERRVHQLISEGRVKGAEKFGRDWAIPEPIEITPGTRGRAGIAKKLSAVKEQSVHYVTGAPAKTPPKKRPPTGA